MTRLDKTVKLRDINPATYTPTTGIDVTWGYDDKDIYGTFSTDRSQAFNDINAELSKLKVIQDTIKDYKTFKKVVPQRPFRTTWYDNGNRMVEEKQ